MKNKKYIAKGFVYGNYWGRGRGAYPSEVVKGNTLKEVEKKIKQGLDSGTLDSGMGYESLLGAIMEIETVITIEHKGKEYTRKESELKFFGELEAEEKNFLEDVFFNI